MEMPHPITTTCERGLAPENTGAGLAAYRRTAGPAAVPGTVPEFRTAEPDHQLFPKTACDIGRRVNPGMNWENPRMYPRVKKPAAITGNPIEKAKNGYYRNDLISKDNKVTSSKPFITKDLTFATPRLGNDLGIRIGSISLIKTAPSSHPELG